MKHIFSILLLFLLAVPLRASAETPQGTIPFEDTDVPTAKFQFHFTRELIALAAQTPPFNTVDDLYIRIYDDDTGLYDRLAQSYNKTLKTQNWHTLQEDERLRLYVLNDPSRQPPRGDDTFTGIFAVVQGGQEVYLLNIVGRVPAHQAGQLLANLGTLGVEIPELKSLPVLEFGEQPSVSPTRFHTAEGTPIHDIQIRGNQKVERAEILKTLRSGDQEIEKAVERLRQNMSTELEQVEVTVEEAAGKQTAVITVKERSASRSSGGVSVVPNTTFNRVTGWTFGSTFEIDFAQARFSSGVPTTNLFGYTGYGFSQKRLDYEIGIDTFPFATYTRFSTPDADPDRWYHGFGITVKAHELTDTVMSYQPSDAFDDDFALFYSIFGGEDLHNYYLKTGAEFGVRWEQLPKVAYRDPRHAVTVTFLAETHESLKKGTDWHLFNWRSTSKARENPIITAGRMRSLLFTYTLNLRRNRLGWHNTFSVEHSTDAFGSTFDFTRYHLHLRYAHPFGKDRIRTRALGSFSTDSLPIQRQFTIGGPGLLNGYPIYAFAGDRGYLFNIEYLFDLPGRFSLGNMQFNFDFNLFLMFFLDAGQTWYVTDEMPTLTPKSDAGIGLQFGESDSFLRINVAQAFESEQGPQLNLLWFYSF